MLSTNTDMIFCPRTADASLSSIAAALEDGFYHLPRFELPEGLWETLDRKDAPAIIASAREWGERFHLNEIVHADHDNLYDGPGDFQLFLREDLFKIGGFHEEMILGWHLDANIARRMRMLRGKVSSALDHLVGYHCDHTRQASPYHKVDRTENDPERFLTSVADIEVPEQMAGWGLADLEIETFPLQQGGAERYKRGLEAAIAKPLTGFLETQYVVSDFGRLDYQPDHVLPYLLDLLSAAEPGFKVAYAGARNDTFSMFARGWRAMGGTSVLLCDMTPWLDADAAPVERLPFAEWVDQADVFVFEAGIEGARHHLDLSAGQSAQLWSVDQAFKRTLDADLARQASGQAPRRVLVVNGLHNFFEQPVMNEVAVTLTPFSSRIRHGYIVDRAAGRAAAASPARRQAMRALEALEPPPTAELARLDELMTAVLEANDPADPVRADAARVWIELDVYAAAGLLRRGPETLEALAALRALRASVQPRNADVVDPDAGRGARSRLVRLEDWENGGWAKLARRMFANREHANLYDREAWTWERISLAENLIRAHPPEGRPHILIGAEHPERAAMALANLGYDVDIVDPRTLLSEAPKAVDWREEYRWQGWMSPAPVGLIEQRLQSLANGFRYDAVLLLQNAVFAHGRAGVADVLQAVCAMLKPGGHLGLTAAAQPLPHDDRVQDHALPYALCAAGAFGAAVQDATALELDGPFDDRLTARTLDRTAADIDKPSLAPPALLKGAADHLEAPSVWSFHLRDGASDWAALKAVLESGAYANGGDAVSRTAGQPLLFTAEDLSFEPVLDPLRPPPSPFAALAPVGNLIKTPLTLTAPASVGIRVIAVAPLGRFTPGGYELEAQVEVRRLAEPGAVLAMAVVSDGEVLAEGMLEVEDAGASRLSVTFQVRTANWSGVSVLFKAQGRADVDIVNLSLR